MMPLKRCDIIISAQGGDYTTEFSQAARCRLERPLDLTPHPPYALEKDRSSSWTRQHAGDPEGASQCGKNWVGGNCTVSCMLMGVGALYKAGLVEWMSTQTYQAGVRWRRAAHARAANAVRHAERRSALHAGRPQSAILEIDRKSLPSSVRSPLPKQPTSACRWVAR